MPPAADVTMDQGQQTPGAEALGRLLAIRDADRQRREIRDDAEGRSLVENDVIWHSYDDEQEKKQKRLTLDDYVAQHRALQLLHDEKAAQEFAEEYYQYHPEDRAQHQQDALRQATDQRRQADENARRPRPSPPTPEQQQAWAKELASAVQAQRAATRDHQSLRRGRAGAEESAETTPPGNETTTSNGSLSPAIAPRGPLSEEGEVGPDEPPTEAPGDTEQAAEDERQRETQLPAGSTKQTLPDETPAKPGDGGGQLTGVNEPYEPFPGAQAGGQAAKGVAAGVAGAAIGAAVAGPAGAVAGARAGGVAGAEAGAAIGSRAGAMAGAESAGAGLAEREAAQAQEIRAGKVATQKEDQQKTNALFRAANKVQEIREAVAAFRDESERLINAAYKQSWQFLQESVEDWALSLTDLFLISGPVTVGLYVLRWMGGNMMGDMFTKEVKPPLPPGIPKDMEFSIQVKIFPPYAFGDLQDNERHMKVLIIGAITALIYGFMIMVLYYWTHWLETILLAIRTGWSAIIDLLRAAFAP